MTLFYLLPKTSSVGDRKRSSWSLGRPEEGLESSFVTRLTAPGAVNGELSPLLDIPFSQRILFRQTTTPKTLYLTLTSYCLTLCHGTLRQQGKLSLPSSMFGARTPRPDGQ